VKNLQGARKDKGSFLPGAETTATIGRRIATISLSFASYHVCRVICPVKMQTCASRTFIAAPAAVRPARASARVVCAANFDGVKKAAATFGIGLAGLALTGSALAANVKLGADNGA
jgi:hypothetical protein